MNGVLVVDKPAGWTSHDVVARVRKIAGERSVGHTGTLDPMATGVLVLLLGKYTRLAQYFGEAEKAYEGEICFGWSTDTYDCTGDPTSGFRMLGGYKGKPLKYPSATVSENERAKLLSQIQELSFGFVGDQDQMPPPFSAKKISGVPAYKLARKGIQVKLEPKRVHVESFQICDLVQRNTPTRPKRDPEEYGLGAWTWFARFHATVSSGTYVRTLVHELGQKVGVGAHLSSLNRTAAGEFSIRHAWKIEEWEEAFITGSLLWFDLMMRQPARISVADMFVHPREILKHMPAVAAPPEALTKIRHGNSANLPEYSKAPLVKVFEGQSELIAIARRVAGTLFQPVTVLK